MPSMQAEAWRGGEAATRQIDTSVAGQDTPVAPSRPGCPPGHAEVGGSVSYQPVSYQPAHYPRPDKQAATTSPPPAEEAPGGQEQEGRCRQPRAGRAGRWPGRPGGGGGRAQSPAPRRRPSLRPPASTPATSAVETTAQPSRRALPHSGRSTAGGHSRRLELRLASPGWASRFLALGSRRSDSMTQSGPSCPVRRTVQIVQIGQGPGTLPGGGGGGNIYPCAQNRPNRPNEPNGPRQPRGVLDVLDDLDGFLQQGGSAAGDLPCGGLDDLDGLDDFAQGTPGGGACRAAEPGLGPPVVEPSKSSSSPAANGLTAWRRSSVWPI
jgi:hypothetical protein